MKNHQLQDALKIVCTMKVMKKMGVCIITVKLATILNSKLRIFKTVVYGPKNYNEILAFIVF